MDHSNARHTVVEPVIERVAVVTGASRGIGAAIADRLAADGYLVVGTATTVQGAQRFTDHMVAKGFPKCRGVALDVNEPGGLQELVDEVLKHYGALHVWVNNAGITRDTLALRMKDEDWQAVIDTNLSATFKGCRAALKPMMKQRWGRLINITSVVGEMGNPGQTNYAASKAGVAGMTRALAREVGSRGITVNCIAPGYIATDMTAALGEEQMQALTGQVPVGRLGQPADIAAAVSYLASEAASYVTGIELPVNGGMLM